jgi:hypothetical protein
LDALLEGTLGRHVERHGPEPPSRVRPASNKTTAELDTKVENIKGQHRQRMNKHQERLAWLQTESEKTKARIRELRKAVRRLEAIEPTISGLHCRDVKRQQVERNVVVCLDALLLDMADVKRELGRLMEEEYPPEWTNRHPAYAQEAAAAREALRDTAMGIASDDVER